MASAATWLPAPASSGEGPPVRSYTIDLSNGPARTAPLQSTPPAASRRRQQHGTQRPRSRCASHQASPQLRRLRPAQPTATAASTAAACRCARRSGPQRRLRACRRQRQPRPPAPRSHRRPRAAAAAGACSSGCLPARQRRAADAFGAGQGFRGQRFGKPTPRGCITSRSAGLTDRAAAQACRAAARSGLCRPRWSRRSPSNSDRSRRPAPATVIQHPRSTACDARIVR